MALTAGEANFISNTAKAAKILMDEFYGLETQNNQLYAGAADFDTTITQGDLDSVASFGGLTTTQVADASFALATILGTINSALQALTVLARLP
jgi:hypothetical protein